MKKIGPNHGAEIMRSRLQEIDPGDAQFAYDTVLGLPGTKYPNNRPNAEATGTLRLLVEGHDELADANVIERLGGLEARIDALPFPFGRAS